MAIRIPERPRYKKERRTVGFLALGAFALLFLCRLFSPHLPFYLAWWLLPLLAAVIALLLPLSVYLAYRGRGYVRHLRLHLPRSSHAPLMIAAFFALLCGSFLLSILCGGTDTLGNTVFAFEQETPKTVWEILLSTLTCAIFPALLEELLFRGVLAVEYEQRGAVRAVMMSSLLFALLHFDSSNFLAHLFTGILMMLVLYATNSLIATAILHVLYNVLFHFIGRYLSALYHFTGNVSLLLFLLALILLVSLIFLCRACGRIYRARDEQGVSVPCRAVPGDVQLYTILDALADPTIILTFLVAIVGFILL